MTVKDLEGRGGFSLLGFGETCGGSASLKGDELEEAEVGEAGVAEEEEEVVGGRGTGLFGWNLLVNLLMLFITSCELSPSITYCWTREGFLGRAGGPLLVGEIPSELVWNGFWCLLSLGEVTGEELDSGSGLLGAILLGGPDSSGLLFADALGEVLVPVGSGWPKD